MLGRKVLIINLLKYFLCGFMLFFYEMMSYNLPFYRKGYNFEKPLIRVFYFNLS